MTSTIAEAVERARAGEVDPRTIVDGAFDAFDREGAGALAAWMILTGNRDALNPILDSIRSLVAQLSIGHEERHVAESTLSLVLNALGDSLLGAPIAEALGLPRDTALAAITTNPASFLGLDDRVGAIAPGLDGDVVIWSGDPLDTDHRAERVFITGTEVYSWDSAADAGCGGGVTRERAMRFES